MKRYLANRPLVLKENEPLYRLYELCKLGQYRYNIFWDKFANGFMITCEVYYYINKQKKLLHKETQFVKDTNDLKYAKNVICESFLHNIGLGSNTNSSSSDNEEEEEYNRSSSSENIFDNVDSQMMSTFTHVLGRTAQTINETIQRDMEDGNEKNTIQGSLNIINPMIDAMVNQTPFPMENIENLFQEIIMHKNTHP